MVLLLPCGCDIFGRGGPALAFAEVSLECEGINLFGLLCLPPTLAPQKQETDRLTPVFVLLALGL